MQVDGSDSRSLIHNSQTCMFGEHLVKRIAFGLVVCLEMSLVSKSKTSCPKYLSTHAHANGQACL